MRACSSGGSLVTSVERLAPTAMPFCTAGRLAISSAQRLTCLNSSRSWPWHLVVDRPRIADHVGDGVLLAGEPLPVGEPVVEHAVEAVGLVGEAVDGVFLIALAVAEPAEMSGLAELGALVGHLPDQPLRDLVLGARILRPELAGLLGDVHHDGAGLEHADGRAAVLGLVVDHHGHAVIGVHPQEVLVELVALLDVHWRDLVFQPALLEQDGDLLAVGRRPVK